VFLGKKPTSTVSTLSKIGSIKNYSENFLAKETADQKSKVVISTITDSKNVKFGRYFVKATTANKLEIFTLSNVDFGVGVKAEFLDDTFKVADVSLGEKGVDIANLGLNFKKGSGTIEEGDSAAFDVWPQSESGSAEVVIGGLSDVYQEFGAIVVGQKGSDGSIFELDIFRCKGIGLPISFEEKAWSEAEITAKALYDPARQGIFKMRYLQR